MSKYPKKQIRKEPVFLNLKNELTFQNSQIQTQVEVTLMKILLVC